MLCDFGYSDCSVSGVPPPQHPSQQKKATSNTEEVLMSGLLKANGGMVPVLTKGVICHCNFMCFLPVEAIEVPVRLCNREQNTISRGVADDWLCSMREVIEEEVLDRSQLEPKCVEEDKWERELNGRGGRVRGWSDFRDFKKSQ
ncbi:hypothetical protein SLEP1_g20427 [Rubroshorea leprosula]|uniref:Uncharacterized protein n=1 Tax=Rubroshorea leprosula TaxID=152421 RepID=A0AAV5J839_9ROSI|nr:hypothetical protein SLEP1_g20427 [Rubroshorea leprosula]